MVVVGACLEVYMYVGKFARHATLSPTRCQMDAQGENISSRERPSNVMKNVYDTFVECLGVASPDAVWATFYPVLREGYEHAREMGRRVERKRQSLPTREQSTMEDANGAIIRHWPQLSHAIFEAAIRSSPSRNRLDPMSRPTDG
ncbi:hypothetical protein E4U22_000256 [Claviceps purpurea]|nr:hypothetical protein E4U22_000256 [Claviceps purpurea]